MLRADLSDIRRYVVDKAVDVALYLVIDSLSFYFSYHAFSLASLPPDSLLLVFAGVGILALIVTFIIAAPIHRKIDERRSKEVSNEPPKREEMHIDRPEPIYSSEQKNFRKKVRYDLFRIRREMSYPWERRAIQFKSWNAFVKPDPRPNDINNPTQFNVIENFSNALNKRNDHLIDTTLDDDCVAEYVNIRKTGFLADDSPADRPRLTVALSKENENEVKELEVRFPGGIRRTPAVRFYYITIRNEGTKTADDVRVRCHGNDVRIIPFTSKSSFGIDVERIDEMGTVEYFDKSIPESAISAILNDHNKVKDSIEFIHPGPEGEKFVLFFTVEGYTDKFFIPAHTKLWYNAYGGHLNAMHGTERRTTKVGIHIGARDITGYYAEFEVMLYDWNSFDVKLVGIVEASYDES
jgi:hypothetical protein